MDPLTSRSRRRFLAASAAGVAFAALTGCADDAADAPADESGTEAGAQNGSASESVPSESDELDLREANVVAVAFEPTDDGYAFDVTLHHDDEGEAGYANWWQVERLDGTLLGRRDLLHAHAEQPFTRSATVAIPDGVTCVVVRGHDQTHGYGGVAAVVNLDGGAVRRVEQGPEPRSFDATDCP